VLFSWQRTWCKRQMPCATGSALSLTALCAQWAINWDWKRTMDRASDWVSPSSQRTKLWSHLMRSICLSIITIFRTNAKMKRHYGDRSVIWYRNRLKDNRGRLKAGLEK
jgi:hypothetical protein